MCVLDLAINIHRTEASGARQKTGTQPFMAIKLLEGTPHSFMHDLESFFWVLFWICMHFGPGGQNGGETQGVGALVHRPGR